MIIIIALIIILLLLIFGILAFVAKKLDDRKTEKDVLKFLVDNPDRASMYVIENGIIVVDHQSNIKMPLASVLKIIVAVEFAEQVALKTINADERVPLETINRFYIPGTDGYAHPEWLEEMEKQNSIYEDGVPLIEVARGMIQFSSNANTEFLMDKIGINYINCRIKELGLEQHDLLYPISSAILMLTYLKNFEKKSHRQAMATIKGYSYEQYALKANQIFNQIRQNFQLINQLNSRKMSMSIQRIWSDKQPRSTTKHYANLLKSIQNGELLSDEANRIMNELMDYKPNPQSKFEKIGRKGGSTLTILNQTLFCRDKSGNQIQLVIFIHDPKRLDIMWLENKLNIFLHQYLNDITFKNQVNKSLMKEVKTASGTDFSC